MSRKTGYGVPYNHLAVLGFEKMRRYVPAATHLRANTGSAIADKAQGGSWTITGGGGGATERAGSVTLTQREAIRRAKNNGGEISIHGRDGRLQSKDVVGGVSRSRKR